MPGTYEILCEDGTKGTMDGDDPEHAMRRYADLHQKTVVAWRTPRIGIYVGPPTGA